VLAVIDHLGSIGAFENGVGCNRVAQNEATAAISGSFGAVDGSRHAPGPVRRGRRRAPLAERTHRGSARVRSVIGDARPRWDPRQRRGRSREVSGGAGVGRRSASI